MIKRNLLETTSEGWNSAAGSLSAIVNPILTRDGFNGNFCKNILELTMGKDNLSEVSKDIRVLDNACGRGPLSLNADLYLSNKLVRDYTIDACDFSSILIEMSNHIKKELKISSITSHVMDGQNLLFNNSHFNYAYSIFGLIYFPDMSRGFNEMFRVLKPGGRIGISSWRSDTPLAGSFYEAYKELTGNEYPSEKPAINLSNPEEFKGYFEKAGFKDINITLVEQDYEVESVGKIVDALKPNPVVISVVEILKPNEKEAYYQVLTKILKSRNISKDPSKVIFPSYVLLGTAQKP